jgi:serine/threonine-protein kinase
VTSPGQIGQYRILHKIGAGGMGMVFVGEHLLLQRRAAIKTLLSPLSMRPEIVERFFNEARATSAISDPGVVQIFDFGYHVDGTAYIVMELLEGEGLASRLDRIGALPIASALRIARQVASSLAAAHAKDIVHRDLKPENIFLIRDAEAQGGERTKIFDFGICAVGRRGATPAEPPLETMIGTPVYMSPEQCTGAAHADPRSDIYGLGCVLYQMLTGSAPFERDSVRDLIRAHLVEEPLPVSSLREEIPPMVDELVRRCLAKSPDARFSSMSALGAAIEQVLARISAPEVVAGAVTPAVLLGDGFRSRFEVRGDPPELPDPPPPSSSTLPAELRGGRLRRAALAIALLGGAVLASLATRLTDRAAASAPEVRAAAPSPQPAAARIADPPPPLPLQPAAARVVEPPAAPPEIPATAPRRAPAAEQAEARDRPARRERPARRAPVLRAQAPAAPARAAASPSPPPPPPPAAPASTEDLYDSR